MNGGKKGKYSTSGKKIKFKTGDYKKSHAAVAKGSASRPLKKSERTRAHQLRPC